MRMASTSTPTDVELSSVDLSDATWFADGPPHELFARMRSEAPVRWNPMPAGSGFWSVTRHADVSTVSRDTDTFSSHEGGVFLQPDQVVPLDLTRNLLLYKDPPEHTKYRKIMQTAFTPRTVATLEAAVRARVARVIDAVIEQGRCDFASDIAVPVPLGVLTELMGVPDSDIPKFYEWTEQIEAATRDAEPNTANDVFVHMAGYLFEQVSRQAEEGSDSLVTQLRAAEVDGESLDDSEILIFFALLVFAGNDTTRNTTATGMNALLDHPEQLAAMRADPAIIPAAIEEILRYTTVVQYFVRTAMADTELDGQTIAKGDKIVMWYTSASRDEAVFDDPQRFDIGRVKPDHKAFGGGGRHFCLGAGLARLELKVIFEEVLRRFGDIHRDGEIERLPSPWAHMITSLPVAFTAGDRES